MGAVDEDGCYRGGGRGAHASEDLPQVLVVGSVRDFPGNAVLICAIMHIGVTANVISPTMRLFLTTGIMGGLTTYSTFDYETYRFTQQGAYGVAALNVLLTLVTCFIAGATGDGLARLLVRS
jgi:protein CrcB